MFDQHIVTCLAYIVTCLSHIVTCLSHACHMFHNYLLENFESLETSVSGQKKLSTIGYHGGIRLALSLKV